MTQRQESDDPFETWNWPGTLAFIWFWTMVAVVIIGCTYLVNR